MTILIIDSDPFYGNAMLEVIKNNYPDVPTTWTQTGGAALDFLFGTGDFADKAAVTPNLILMSLELTGLNALEILRLTKSYERLKRIPVVMLTTSPQPTLETSGFDLGAVSIIYKLPSTEEFVRIIKETTYYWLKVANTPS